MMPPPNRQAAPGVDKIQLLHRKLGELDHYALLGVPRGAEVPLIQSAVALRRALMQSHVSGSDSPGQIHDIIKALDRAWSVLGDPVRRDSYDRSLLVTSRAATPVDFAFTRADHSQEVFSQPVGRATAAPPQPPPRSMIVGPPTRRSSPTLSWLPSPLDELEPSPSRRTPSAPPPRPLARDPWLGSSLPTITAEDALEAMGVALEAALAALAAQGAVDPRLDDARHSFTYVRLRRTVGLAREHEAHGRWEQASQAWARAANGCPDDAWLLAHAARTARLANPMSDESGRLARHALAVDPENPLARQVIASLGAQAFRRPSVPPPALHGSAPASGPSPRQGDGASAARSSIPPSPMAANLRL